MEIMEDDLENFLNQNYPEDSQTYLSFPEIKHILVSIYSGLIFLEKNNINHKVLKLSNILLNSQKPENFQNQQAIPEQTQQIDIKLNQNQNLNKEIQEKVQITPEKEIKEKEIQLSDLQNLQKQNVGQKQQILDYQDIKYQNKIQDNIQQQQQNQIKNLQQKEEIIEEQQAKEIFQKQEIIQEQQKQQIIQEQQKQEIIQEQQQKEIITEQEIIQEQQKQEIIQEQQKQEIIQEQQKKEIIKEQQKEETIQKKQQEEIIQEQQQEEIIQEKQNEEIIQLPQLTIKQEQQQKQIANEQELYQQEFIQQQQQQQQINIQKEQKQTSNQQQQILNQNNINQLQFQPQFSKILNSVFKISDQGQQNSIFSSHSLETNYNSVVDQNLQYTPPEFLINGYEEQSEFYQQKQLSWALGVILYRMIFNKFPYNTNNVSPLAYLNNIQKNNLDYTSRKNIPQSLLQITKCLLDINVDQRIYIERIQCFFA